MRSKLQPFEWIIITWVIYNNSNDNNGDNSDSNDNKSNNSNNNNNDNNSSNDSDNNDHNNDKKIVMISKSNKCDLSQIKQNEIKSKQRISNSIN